MYINPTTINETYDRCKLRRHESIAGAISVPGFLSTAHVFSRKKVEQQREFIVCALKKLPRNIRRSNGCTGVPWIIARHVVAQDRSYSLEVIDKLLAMAVSIELVTVVFPEDSATDVAYIVIEDERAMKISRANKEYKNAIWK
ncbi:MAG: hypothetical protein IJY59_01880 [Bacteroidaceae bacterium]|nr:hypothetical protein [Bacteroidaceae bacterium]